MEKGNYSKLFNNLRISNIRIGKILHDFRVLEFKSVDGRLIDQTDKLIYLR